jgi:hypothetical protein
MPALPRRTHETSLTDDELLLFDFMFDVRVPQRALTQDAYPFHMNVRYSHALDDQGLRETLDSLARRGLVVRSVEDSKTLWSLTPLGGEQWERERKPLWHAYCTEFDGTLRSGKSLLMVLSPERATAENFWNVGSKTRVWEVGNEQPRYWRIQNHRLIPWRSFPAIHVLVARGASYADAETDWEAYEANRTWWRGITELDRLRKKLT